MRFTTPLADSTTSRPWSKRDTMGESSQKRSSTGQPYTRFFQSRHEHSFKKLVKSLNVKAKPIAGLFGEKDDQGSEQGSNQHSKGLWD